MDALRLARVVVGQVYGLYVHDAEGRGVGAPWFASRLAAPVAPGVVPGLGARGGGLEGVGGRACQAGRQAGRQIRRHRPRQRDSERECGGGRQRGGQHGDVGAGVHLGAALGRGLHAGTGNRTIIILGA